MRRFYLFLVAGVAFTLLSFAKPVFAVTCPSGQAALPSGVPAFPSTPGVPDGCAPQLYVDQYNTLISTLKSVGPEVPVCSTTDLVKGMVNIGGSNKIDLTNKDTINAIAKEQAIKTVFGSTDPTVGPHGCPLCRLNNGDDVSMRMEVCQGKGTYYYGSCYCIVNGVDDPSPQGDMVSATTCNETCKAKNGRPSTNRGVGRYFAKSQTDESAAKDEYINSMCFTKDECADPKYGGTTEAFVADAMCPDGQGRCLAPEPEVKLSVPIMGVDTVKGLKNYIVLAFKYLLSIVVITAAVMFVYGGFKYVLAASAGSVDSAKETMVNAVIGMVVTIGATMLLNTINPETTNLNRLNIFLIKPIDYSNQNWCRDYKPTQGATIMFADAGNPAGSTNYNGAKFEVPVENTSCGVQYYPSGFGGKTCQGDKCAEKGKTCISCQDAKTVKECVSNPNGYACARAMIAGTIGWSDDTYPQHIYLVPFCYYMQPDVGGEKMADWIKNPSAVKDNLLDNDMMEGILVGKKSDKTGSVDYYFPSYSKDQMDTIASKCASKGKIDGWLIAVQYHDNVTLLKELMTKNAGPGFVNKLNAVTGSFLESASSDDWLVVTKNDCKGAPQGTKSPASLSYFSGYSSGDRGWTVSQQVAVTVFCGYMVSPGQGIGCTTNKRFDWVGEGASNPWFSFQDLLHSVTDWDGKQQSIRCDFDLNFTTAPREPASVLMNGCGTVPGLVEHRWNLSDFAGFKCD